MAFGKRKSQLPRPSQAGKTTVSSRPDVPVRLTMTEAAFFAQYLASARGYPRDALEDIGHRILWLEQRGLPGLTYFASDVLETQNIPLRSRCPDDPAEGQQIFDPIIAGTHLKLQFDTYCSPMEGQFRAVSWPVRSFLTLPKIAEAAEQRNMPVLVALTKNQKISTRILIHDQKIALEGDIQAVVEADGIGLAKYSQFLPEQMTGPINEFVFMSSPLMEQIVLYTKDFPAPAAGRTNTAVDMAKSVPISGENAGQRTTGEIDNFIVNNQVLVEMLRGLALAEKTQLQTMIDSPVQATHRISAGTTLEKIFGYLMSLSWTQPVDAEAFSHASAMHYQFTPAGRLWMGRLLAKLHQQSEPTLRQPAASSDPVFLRLLQALSRGELSNHIAMLSQVQDGVLMTTRNSANGEFCAHLISLGWMEEIADPALDVLPPGTSITTYRYTELGKTSAPPAFRTVGIAV